MSDGENSNQINQGDEDYALLFEQGLLHVSDSQISKNLTAAIRYYQQNDFWNSAAIAKEEASLLKIVIKTKITNSTTDTPPYKKAKSMLAPALKRI